MIQIDPSWYDFQSGLPVQVSAGGVVVRQAEGQTYIAVVRAGPEKFAVLPKGQVEAGETLEAAAHREIAEEAGLTDLVLVEKFEYLQTKHLSVARSRGKSSN